MLDMTTIRTLGANEKISEPGFYEISLERHHNQPCDGVSVTSSTLRTMEIATPADVWAFHPLNPKRWEREEKTPLRLGRAMALYIEGGLERLEEGFRVLPAGRPNKPTLAQEIAYREGRASDAAIRSIMFWREIAADPRDVITEAEWEMLANMGKALRLDPAASAALGGHPEITIAWKDEINDLWCLSRPDQISFSGMLSDYKKVSTQGRPFSARLVDHRITEHGYHQQMAFAAEGFETLTGNWPDEVGLVFQSDQAPHHVILRAIDEEDLRFGMFQNRRARARFRECLDSGHWPGPGEHVGSYQMPKYFRERLIEEMQIAGTAP